MAKKAVSPSITKGQAGKFADLLTTALAKSGLPSDGTQRVREQHGAALAVAFIGLVSERVDATAKVICRTVAVDRTLSPEAAIAATGRRQYVTAGVLASMPPGEGETAVIEFIPLEKWMSDEKVDAKLAEYGLVAADPYALAAFSVVEPAFADDRPCFTHWQDADGKWCSAAFGVWGDERCVGVYQFSIDWSGRWWATGVRK